MTGSAFSRCRRTAGRVAVAVAALALLLVAASCGRNAPPPPPQAARPGPAAGVTAPTVLLVTIDTLRADRLGCYGRADAGTPALDALAAAGARFENAQTTAPLTLPAHASILTGRTVPAHGVRNNGTFAVPGDVPVAADVFQHAGYATGAFVSSPVLAFRHGLARGFQQYDDDVPRATRREGLVTHYDERAGVDTVRRALLWLAQQGARPAFVWVHLWEPHAPYHPPAEFARFADRYQGEVATADAALGLLVREVAALGRERVLVVVAGDHGEGLGEHGEPTHGVYLYRATMHVPLIVSGPAFGVKPAVVMQPASLADLAPTLLGLAGLPPLRGADGLSLADALTGKGAFPARAGVFAESHLPQIEFGWSGLRALVTPEHKFIDAPRAELYDLRADPDEQKDLSTQRAAVDVERRALDEAVRRAAAAAPAAGADRSASPAELDTLRSLGYAASGRKISARRLVDPHAADPKDRARFLARYDEATGLVERGSAPQGVTLFEELDREDPRNPGLLLAYGQALIMSRRLDDAVKVFRRAVAVDPGYSLAWYRLGQLLDNAKDAQGAENAYRRAIDADPLSLEPRKALASFLADQGRFDLAIDTLERAKELDPQDRAINGDLERFYARTRR